MARIAEQLSASGWLEAVAGDAPLAARLLGSVVWMREQFGLPLLPEEQALEDEHFAEVRGMLEEEQFEEESARWRGASLGDAIAVVLAGRHA